MDHSTSHSLSTMIHPSNATTLNNSVYLRIEGYYLMLVNPINGKHLIPYFFNLMHDT